MVHACGIGMTLALVGHSLSMASTRLSLASTSSPFPSPPADSSIIICRPSIDSMIEIAEDYHIGPSLAWRSVNYTGFAFKTKIMSFLCALAAP